MFVKAPEYQELANRLFEICKWEGLNADLRTMLLLCELTDGDIRSALNTLQFIGQRTRNITHKQLLNATGSKDVSKDWTYICKQIFHVPTAKQKKTVAFKKTSEVESKSSNESAYIIRLSTLLQANGDHDKIMQACYENYLSTKVFDLSASRSTSETRFVQQGHYLNMYDQLNIRINRDQQFELMQYISYPIIAFHRYFACAKKLDIEFPKADYQFRVAKQLNENIAESIWMNMIPTNKMIWQARKVMITELLPFLVFIIAPDLKPLNIQVMKFDEMIILMKIVDVLSAFGFKLVQERRPSGGFTYKLDPYLVLTLDLWSR
jgi:chromosome transmission fidelity protein 18